MLTLLIFIPLLFGLVIAILPSSLRNSFKYITLLATLVQFGMSLWIYMSFKGDAAHGGIMHEDQFQFVQKLPWIHLEPGRYG